ncbi:hypothetical protein DdX_13921 [Ditylenchus destructor]|uniref:Uncharacterized protein n=1 Tax=Ditylenchus destructor TaxID=166010 RepID=A0AAD4QZ36_9BILA|nr:hypothetical protein DdX_13921 [Ditylenchus destructor]
MLNRTRLYGKRDNLLSKKTIICDKKEDAVDTRIDVLRSLSVNQIKALEVDKVKGFVHTRKMPSSVYYATNMPKLQIKGTVLDVSRSGLFSLHGPLPVGPVKRHKAKKLFMLPEDESLLVPGPLREFELEMDLVNGKAVWKLIRKAEHNSDPKTEL